MGRACLWPALGRRGGLALQGDQHLCERPGAGRRAAHRRGPRRPAAGEAAASWAGLQARADDLTQELYSLRESAPREEDRDLVADALASLQALRSAMAEEQAAGRAGGAGSPEAAQVHSRLMSFEASLRALRAPEEQLPRNLTRPGSAIASSRQIRAGGLLVALLFGQLMAAPVPEGGFAQIFLFWALPYRPAMATSLPLQAVGAALVGQAARCHRQGDHLGGGSVPSCRFSPGPAGSWSW